MKISFYSNDIHILLHNIYIILYRFVFFLWKIIHQSGLAENIEIVSEDLTILYQNNT